MRLLKKTTDVYKVADEEEAIALIKEFKDNQHAEGYTVTKSGYVLKTRKSKGEIIDSWMITTIERTFDEWGNVKWH